MIIMIMNTGVKLYQKNTTFTKRPVLPQIISYIIFALETILFYSIVITFLQGPIKITMIVLYTISFVSLTLSGTICSRTDPSDQAMVLFRNHTKQQFEDYRNQKKIKFLYCDFCNSFVKQKSRHCKICDRCTQNFDHHCMWINNCIGEYNYKAFFTMIVSAFGNLLLYVISLILVTVRVSFQQNLGQMVVTWISGAINSVFTILLLNLIFLHLYLLYQGMSTFEFIIAQRNLQLKKKQQQQNVVNAQQKVIQKKKESISRDQQNTNQILHNKVVMGHERQVQLMIKSTNKEKKVSSEYNEDNQQNNLQNPQYSTIFGQNDATQKSSSYDGEKKSNKAIIREQPEKEYVESQQSSGGIEISQLFMRNKSLKLMIGKNQHYVPHKLKKGQQLIMRESKSKSMFSDFKRLK